MVTVLFTRKKSVYKLLGFDCYDIDRDSRTFTGDNPVICHPPCRAWGRYAYKAKPREDEKDLALFAVDMVRKNGGVLEHPAHSKLWDVCQLPLPGYKDSFGGWTLFVNQSWFGHRAIKPTFLYIVGVLPRNIPFYSISYDLVETNVEKMCRAERERTPEKFAKFLVSLASLCKK